MTNEPCDHYDVQNYDRYDICEKCGMKWLSNIMTSEHYDTEEPDCD